ncbi:hypothetical protein K490DRAFT_65108 [Saccharata proteae CBS 121410]|uniref:Uncharacterized protein n=1 Tax=Saccharata proteae CBS 121410 TaxID=1314787 RepID=A0A9P4HW29_9PEZI|nr:hypothetical protein K490DRAFT_65108 [Saccharata proteae CBS 121410]
MAPNLLVATQTLFAPQRWFSKRRSSKPVSKTEHWDDPTPGQYEYIPGRGWYLTRPDTEAGEPGERLDKPKHVLYSRVLRRYLFDTEYQRRKLSGDIKDANGKWKEVGFFQLDDGVAWVNCWDSHGEFIPGPYERWCIDDRTEKFRKMLKGDDPAWRSRHSSRSRRSGEDGVVSSKAGSDDGKGTSSEESGTVYTVPREGHSRPASAIDLVLSPPVSRPGSVRNIPRSEGATRSNSVSNGSATQPNSRPGSTRALKLDDNGSKANSSCANCGGSNATRGLAAAVASKLRDQENLDEHTDEH